MSLRASSSEKFPGRKWGVEFMHMIFAFVRVALGLVLPLIFIAAAKAEQPVQIESDAGVISMIATVEGIDVTNQVLTVSGPQNNWVTVKVTPEDIERIKVKDRITISYSDEVAVALQKLNEAPQNQMASQEESGMNYSMPQLKTSEKTRSKQPRRAQPISRP